MAWKNRILGTGEESPDQLVANPRNWRIHSHLQEGTIKGVLSTVGWVDHVIVNQRSGFIVDGHARVLVAMDAQEPTVPVLYVDLTDEEEALILASFDSVGDMASRDGAKLADLLQEVDTDDLYLRELLTTLEKELAGELDEGVGTPGVGEHGSPLPGMELQPYEHYDYVVLLFRTTQDWDRACAVFGLGKQRYEFVTRANGKPRTKIGMGRVVDGLKALEQLGAVKDESCVS